ncbi:MAG: DUF1269 domain-containing protein [Dehalococcoidia bacterium]|nr:DUF1269 domain-containing protein [Dehalococcoidia bacterium]
MADLVIIGYPDESTAELALTEVEQLRQQMVLQVDGAAAVIRHADGKVKVHAPEGGTAVGGGAMWGVLWGTLFGVLFLVPIIGAITGGALGALFGGLDRSGIDRAYRDRVKEQLQPGTSALVMVIYKMTPDKAVTALSRFGGTVLQTSLSEEAERHLEEALKGEYTPSAVA